MALACDEWQVRGQEDALTEEEFNMKWPALAGHGNDACSWTITGQTEQDKISDQQYKWRVLQYIRELENWGMGLSEMLKTLLAEPAPLQPE